jgi:hypothetical protein
MVDGEQIYGDGVNVAARLESLADPGGICIARTVHEQIRNKLALSYEDLGDQTVKNIAEPVRVFRVMLEGGTARHSHHGQGDAAVPEKTLARRRLLDSRARTHHRRDCIRAASLVAPADYHDSPCAESGSDNARQALDCRVALRQHE